MSLAAAVPRIAFYYGAALLVLIAAVLLAIFWRRRADSTVDADRQDAPPGPQPAAPLAADAEATRDKPADTLKSQLARVSAELWASALSAAAIGPDVPAGHQLILDATRTALGANPLAERYFPRRPMLMPQLLAAVNDPDAPPLKLAEIIAKDPVLTGNILRLANSVVFRLSAVPVESIQRAVVVCGTDGLQSLAATALVQPVFRSDSESHSRFPAVLWERCTRASLAAETCARQWCPADRQAAQLLALLSALGPLVVYRVVQDQYRSHPTLPPMPAVFLLAINRYSVVMAARIAALWETPPRIVAILGGERQADDGAPSPLERSLLAGELLASLSLLVAEGRMAEAECAGIALAAGIPAALYSAVWVRLRPPAD
jgi:HD-like signal output (HDOD) protein